MWLVIAVVLMSLFESFTSSDASNARTYDYTSFVKEVQQGQIQEVVFDGNVINGLKRSGEKFVTVMPMADRALLDSLIVNNVRTSGTKPEEPNVLLSIFIS